MTAAVLTGLKALAGIAAYLGLGEILNQIINNPNATDSDAKKIFYQISNKAAVAGINIEGKAANAMLALDQLLNSASTNSRKAIQATKNKINGYTETAKQLRNDIAELEGQAQGLMEDISKQNAFTKKDLKQEREKAMDSINTAISQKSQQLDQIERRIQ